MTVSGDMCMCVSVCAHAVCFLLLITTQMCGHLMWAWLGQAGCGKACTAILVGPMRSIEIKGHRWGTEAAQQQDGEKVQALIPQS